jgi:hypothetical protein
MNLALTDQEAGLLRDLLDKPIVLQCVPTEWPGCDKTHLIFVGSGWEMTAEDMATYYALRVKFNLER